MKRKNKRHDSKATPDKSPEKPSRRSNRHSKRRRKSSSSSSSPEREKVHSKSKDTAVKDIPPKANEKVRSYTPEKVTEKVKKEVVEKNNEQEAGSSRRGSKRHSESKVEIDIPVKKEEGGGEDSEWKEDKSFWEGDEKVEEKGDKAKEKESSSVWKVQSANGAGGEIQKLKICRQRMADAQEDSSPKRRSSRNREAGQKNPDENSSDTEDQTSNVDNDKNTKLKIRTRTSSRNSPALLDSPKVICDVSEDNPTRIKIHIENKSPEKMPLNSPVLINKDKSEELNEVVEDVKISNEDEAAKGDCAKEKDKEDKQEEKNPDLKNDVADEDQQKKTEEPVEETAEAPKEIEQQLPKDDSGDINKVDINGNNGNEEETIKDKEQKDLEDSSVSKTAVEITEEVVSVDTKTDAEESEPQTEKVEEVPVAKSSSPTSTSPRKDKDHSSGSSRSSSEESNDSDSNDSESNGKKAKRRKDGMLSTVTRQTRAATESPPPAEETEGREETSGKQEPEEELEEGEAPDEEEDMEKKIPVASDKENTMNSAVQSSFVSGSSEPVQRKRRWGASKTIRPPKKPVLCISTDSLKNLIPEAKPVSIEEVRLSVEEDNDRIEDEEDKEEKTTEKKEVVEDARKKEKKESKREPRERHREKDKEKEEKKPKEKVEPTKTINLEKSSPEKVNRRICVLSDDARKLVRSPSPARHRPSSVLFITNLVRPFTVPQLRNLLARTGKIAENGFWIDKIKSKCYVQYTDEEAAIETRHALHGVRWPVSNPRTLCVEFASYDDMAVAQALSEVTEPIPRKAEPLQVDHSVEGWLADQARINVDRSQRRVVREWDVGKPAHPDEELDLRPSRPGYDDIRDRERERERERERDRDRRSKKDRSHRSRTPDIHEPPSRKPRRKDEDAPAKLLDDLFRKTKTSPCIYWLPLTAEQIVVKEEMRRQHMAEHERRVAEMKKAEQARRDRDRRRK